MSDRRIISNINVTPLVDVMLVLLVIFMVTAPMMEAGIDVNLPKADAGALKAVEDPIIITINKEGKIFINKKVVTNSELKKKLKAIYKRRKDSTIYLKADASVAYGVVAKTMAEIRSSGLEKIAMVTEPDGAKNK